MYPLTDISVIIAMGATSLCGAIVLALTWWADLHGRKP